MKIQDITSFLESVAPGQYQEDYDNAGLIVGNPLAETNKALICLDCTEEVVDEAIEEGADLIISHHPIVFSGMKRFNGDDYVQRTIMKAIKNDVAIFASHTNLDSVSGGVNSKICEVLGLQNTSILRTTEGTLLKLYTFVPTESADSVRSAIFAAGAGHIGNYSECSYNMEGFGTFKGDDSTDPHVGKPGEQHNEPEVKMEMVVPSHLKNRVVAALKKAHPYEEVAYDLVRLENGDPGVGMGMIGELPKPLAPLPFLEHVKSALGTQMIRHTELPKNNVTKVAVCGGSGSFLLQDAIRSGAEALVSADFKYHQFFDADGKILIADVGHYESEQHTTTLIHDLLSKEFSTFALLFSKTRTNPINYL